MMWLLGASTISYYQEMAAEEALTSSGPLESAERLYDKKRLPHPKRSPITALRVFFGIAMLAGTCIVSTPSLSSAAELYPFSLPTSQQTPAVDQAPQVKPQLSKDDISRIARLADQAKKLTPDEQRQLQESIQRKQKDAVRQGDFNQAQYYTELHTQIGQENR